MNTMIAMSRKNLNWSVPEPIWKVFDSALEKNVNKRQKWLGAVAAMLMYLDATDEERQKYLIQASQTAFKGEAEKMAEAISSGHRGEVKGTLGEVITDRVAAKRPKEVKGTRPKRPRT